MADISPSTRSAPLSDDLNEISPTNASSCPNVLSSDEPQEILRPSPDLIREANSAWELRFRSSWAVRALQKFAKEKKIHACGAKAELKKRIITTMASCGAMPPEVEAREFPGGPASAPTRRPALSKDEFAGARHCLADPRARGVFNRLLAGPAPRRELEVGVESPWPLIAELFSDEEFRPTAAGNIPGDSPAKDARPNKRPVERSSSELEKKRASVRSELTIIMSNCKKSGRNELRIEMHARGVKIMRLFCDFDCENDPSEIDFVLRTTPEEPQREEGVEDEGVGDGSLRRRKKRRGRGEESSGALEAVAGMREGAVMMASAIASGSVAGPNFMAVGMQLKEASLAEKFVDILQKMPETGANAGVRESLQKNIEAPLSKERSLESGEVF